MHRDRKIFIINQDNGAGISESVKSKVFDTFFTTKEVIMGTGQGLAIANDVIVKNHSGAITVESEEDAGTSFTVTLPC